MDLVRPPRRDEMAAYYRTLPFANRLPSWEPAGAAWHGGPEPWPPQRTPASAEQLKKWAAADFKLDGPEAYDDDTGASRHCSVRFTTETGAEWGEHTDTSTTWCSGHRDMSVNTQAGDLELAIPKLRAGSFFLSLLECRRRIDQAQLCLPNEV